jgi:hypothetical protein
MLRKISFSKVNKLHRYSGASLCCVNLLVATFYDFAEAVDLFGGITSFIVLT